MLGALHFGVVACGRRKVDLQGVGVVRYIPHRCRIAGGRSALLSLQRLRSFSELSNPSQGSISSMSQDQIQRKLEELLKTGKKAEIANKAKNQSFHSEVVGKMINEAVALLDKKELEKGIQKLQEAMKADPYSPEIRCFLGHAQRLAGNVIEARRLFEKAITMKPSYSDAHQGLGTIAMGERDFYTARLHFFDALELEPKNVAVLLHIAQSFLAENQDQKAKTYFEKAFELDPKNSSLCASLGETCARLNEIVEARNYLEKAVQLEPNNGGAICSYCVILVELKEYDVALQNLKRLVQITKDPILSQEQRGVPLRDRIKGLGDMWASKLKFFWEKKDIRSSESIANLVAEIQDNKEILMFCVSVKIRTYQLDEAETLLRRILQKDPTDKNANLVLSGLKSMQDKEKGR